ncbi:ATP-binding protein [Aquibacillus sp. 3ASR75-11]|uniref:histidine kinase n=1 Tax=Terrihalobacillus insolitus TaxID=2950438 RepID=A0A9X4AMC3_9BACI|nr:ATP-binding protein [Terrihalobacillus insolitus]MDC3411974.1 ATP-binding protein [Terrihalobacillus insolitus]MDC3423340.1 ATP-binding protein [Terrihalobacillus insolitus]
MKLRGKILISLTTVIIFMGLFQSLFFQTRVEKIFENYLSENDEMKIDMMKQTVISYYNSTGSLKGVDQFLESSNRIMMNMGKMMGNQDETIGIIIADTAGEIVANTTPKNMENNASSVTEPIVIEGKTIGTFKAYPIKSASVSRIEQQFVQSVNLTILLGFLFAGIITLIIGFFLSKKITSPLSQLVSGIEHVSKGNTKYQVKIDSKDEFKQLGDAFNQMTETLEKTEHIRKSLVADVAHELRTPLAIIRAKLESIQAGALEATEEVILNVSDEVYRLSRLVNDLQQLSLAESKTLSLHKKRTEINGFMESILSQFEWFADEKGIKLQLNKSSNDLFIEIDQDRMTQVVVNLLGNALRYTPDNGTVTVHVKVEGESVVLSFKDTGPGIDEQKLPFIFERFYRIDDSRKRDEGGAGLGLSIAKGFVEIHGGNINVTSTKGEGTEFKVSLPIQ